MPRPRRSRPNGSPARLAAPTFLDSARLRLVTPRANFSANPESRPTATRQEYRRAAGRPRAAGAPRVSRRHVAISGGSMAEKHRLSVLVIDRDEATVVDVKDFLAQEGFRVQVSTDPGGIVDEVKQGKYQLVLLDASPPADPAIDLLDQIRAADSDLCVVAMTARPTVEVAVRALKRQAFDYLEKPLAMEELRAVIEAAIREKGLLIDVETRLNQIVGGRLRERRQGESLTLKQLANRTGLSVSLISQIELGKSAASMSTLYKLATALQVKMTYFFETV